MLLWIIATSALDLLENSSNTNIATNKVRTTLAEFKIAQSKLVSLLGTQLWKLSDLYEFDVIKESQASEGRRIGFLKSEVIKIWELNSHF